MGENPSPNTPMLSHGQFLLMAFGLALGVGAVNSIHHPFTGIVVGALIFFTMVITYAFVSRRKPR